MYLLEFFKISLGIRVIFLYENGTFELKRRLITNLSKSAICMYTTPPKKILFLSGFSGTILNSNQLRLICQY